MSIKIIGAGFGRTGTHSLKLALEVLGFGKCYHMEDLIMDRPHDVTFWERLWADKEVEWDEFFKGYQSAVDAPTNLRYKDFIKQYPNAKVILTIRNPENWYKSFGETIIKSANPGLGEILSMSMRMPFSKKLRQRLRVLKFVGQNLKGFFPQGFENKEVTISIFEEWNKNVINSVPQEKLLVFNVKEGWQPLCEFLNVPIPDRPFPHSNKSEEFNSRKL